MNKPSRGVKILAWFYIVGSMITICRVFFSIAGSIVFKIGIKNQSASNFILAIIGVWIAWYVLKLKGWARRWIIYLNLLGIGRMILWLPYGLTWYKSNYRGADLMRELWILGITICLSFIVCFIYIYFFTRPSIKKQFIN